MDEADTKIANTRVKGAYGNNINLKAMKEDSSYFFYCTDIFYPSASF
jgi:hypothetical protein